MRYGRAQPLLIVLQRKLCFRVLVRRYVRVVKEAVSSARELERRKRRGGPLLVAGLTQPKALAPLLPIYLQASLLLVIICTLVMTSCCVVRLALLCVHRFVWRFTQHTVPHTAAYVMQQCNR